MPAFFLPDQFILIGFFFGLDWPIPFQGQFFDGFQVLPSVRRLTFRFVDPHFFNPVPLLLWPLLLCLIATHCGTVSTLLASARFFAPESSSEVGSMSAADCSKCFGHKAWGDDEHFILDSIRSCDSFDRRFAGASDSYEKVTIGGYRQSGLRKQRSRTSDTL
jgi:hypothetical protein